MQPDNSPKKIIMTYSANIKKLERSFLPKDFALNTWEDIKPFFDELHANDISTKKLLEEWLKKYSELEAVISEDSCWRQIKMTCDNENKSLEEAFQFFCLEIQPKIQPVVFELNKKLLASPALPLLDEVTYFTFLRNIKKSVQLFNEKNVAIQAQIQILAQEYGQITGAMMVTINDQSYTLQQASKFLQHEDRAIREAAYFKIQERRLQDKENLDGLFNKLLALRNTEALQAGFENYSLYRFTELGRFDYTAKECIDFHEAVKQHVLPLVKEIYLRKKEKLGIELLKPWDIDAEPKGIQPLTPFKQGTELLEKTIDCFTKLHPFFADCLKHMSQLGHFDVESRKGKSPGGYNCPLAESGAPFIFMNAAGQMHDVTTMVHEGGHAVHSFLAHPLALNGFKEYPMEIAEVASMAMELFSMEHWDSFFDNVSELKRAKLEQLEGVITIFPWIAIIDKFQHWIYKNPTHTVEERTTTWKAILLEFYEGIVDYEGLEHFRANAWQRQLHLFEVPFYYIEYGIAQLGAIGLYQQYKNNPQQALENYMAALSLGGTKTLPELYKAAELEFNFSPDKIKNLMRFIHEEMEALETSS
jgi:oligoendopeptidase F